VASLAELFFSTFPLVDEAGALERGGRVIRGEGQQQLVHRRGKVAALGGGDDDASFAVDADRDGEAAPRLRVADVGNDLLTQERLVRGEASLQPVRKARPRVPARDLDCRTATGIAQAYERKVELQQIHQRVGEPG